jgi:hypothetical protein
LPVPEQTDVTEVVQREKDGPSDDFKRKVAKWEAAGVFDKIATRVEEGMGKAQGCCHGG